MGKQSELEATFALLIRHAALDAGMESEHRFASPRRWRFDFAWPVEKLAVEIDGLVWNNRGGHQTVAGIMADCEKYETALLNGWRVYRVPGPWLADRPWGVLDAVRQLLERQEEDE